MYWGSIRLRAEVECFGPIGGVIEFIFPVTRRGYIHYL